MIQRKALEAVDTVSNAVDTSLERIKDDLYLPGGELNGDTDHYTIKELGELTFSNKTLKMSVNLLELRHGMSTVKSGRLLSLFLSPLKAI